MYDLVIIGHGVAGLAAAVSAAEASPSAQIVVLERAPESASGGNTRYSPANIRMRSVNETTPNFVEDMMAASGASGDIAYFQKLADQAPAAAQWLERQGVRFHTMDYFLASWPSRIQPVGKGAAIIAALQLSAKAKSVRFVYECRAKRLRLGKVSATIETEDGQRFIAKSVVLASGGFEGLVHDTWEQLSRTIHFETPDRSAWVLCDSRLFEVEGYQAAIRSDIPPLVSDTIPGLASQMGVPQYALVETISSYNAACNTDLSRFNAGRPDGLSTAPHLKPPKSNWARPLNAPQYLAFPLAAAIVYTFGGLATDTEARVMTQKGPISNLYAAGEISGHFHQKAPNAVAVLRALVFGRIAGLNAIKAK